MNISRDIIDLDPARIEDQGPWLFWKSEPDESFLSLFRAAGQIEPVLVEEADEGQGHSHRLVAGYKRLAACRALGVEVLARKVEAEDTEKGFLNILTNLGRPLTDADRFLVFRYFHLLYPEDMLAGVVAPVLGLDPRSRDTALHLAWFRLPDDYDPHLREGRIPLTAARPLAGMSRRDQQACEIFFSRLSWSRSSAMALLTGLDEAARARGATVADLVEEGGLMDLAAGELSPKDAMAAILDRVRSLRRPVLSAMRERFSRLAGTLTRAHPGADRVRVVQPDDFETDAVEVSFRACSAKELAETAKALADMAASPDASRLFTLAEEAAASGEEEGEPSDPDAPPDTGSRLS